MAPVETAPQFVTFVNRLLAQIQPKRQCVHCANTVSHGRMSSTSAGHWFLIDQRLEAVPTVGGHPGNRSHLGKKNRAATANGLVVMGGFSVPRDIPQDLVPLLQQWWSSVTCHGFPPDGGSASDHSIRSCQEPVWIESVPSLQTIYAWCRRRASTAAKNSVSSCCRLLEAAARRGVTAIAGEIRGEPFGYRGTLAVTGVASEPFLTSGPRIAVLSSHLGMRPDRQPLWFLALRTVLALPVPGATFLVGASSTVAPWAERWARRTGRRVWLVEDATAALGDDSRRATDAWRFLSCCATAPIETPRLVLTHRAPGTGATGESAVKRDAVHLERAIDDAAACGLADWVIVLAATERGRIGRILRQLGHAAHPPRLWLMVGQSLVPKNRVEHVAWPNAVAWSLSPQATARRCVCMTPISVSKVSQQPVAQLREPYLIHWTRAHPGPWPDQSDAAYYDELLLDGPGASREPLDALLRILRYGRIAPGWAAIRGKTPVVCFSDIELSALKQLQVYRKHRHRWDFSCYGIAISRQWLQQRGARPVIYGDDATWKTLPEKDRPFFQRRTTATGRYDWTAEREWRMVGPCLLSDLPEDKAAVFVPTWREARIVAYMSRWPVIALEGSSSSRMEVVIW